MVPQFTKRPDVTLDAVAVRLLGVCRYVLVNVDGSVARLNRAGRPTSFCFTHLAWAARNACLRGAFIGTRDGDGNLVVLEVRR